MSAKAEHYDVIRKPVITEKATMASDANAVVFEVSIDSNKPQIKEAVEALLKWCEIGSPRAKVDALTWSEIDPEHIIHFEVRR